MGSNKVLKVALGKTESEEYLPGVHQLSARATGNVGLFFTKLPRAEVEALFDGFQARPEAPAQGSAPCLWGGFRAQGSRIHGF